MKQFTITLDQFLLITKDNTSEETKKLMKKVAEIPMTSEVKSFKVTITIEE